MAALVLSLCVFARSQYKLRLTAFSMETRLTHFRNQLHYFLADVHISHFIRLARIIKLKALQGIRIFKIWSQLLCVNDDFDMIFWLVFAAVFVISFAS